MTEGKSKKWVPSTFEEALGALDNLQHESAMEDRSRRTPDKVCIRGGRAIDWIRSHVSASPSDEGSHTGAATLEVKPGEVPVMDGQYWTRRKWREGMNTAGLIRVDRVNVAHAPRTEDLLAFARASVSSAKLLRKR